MPDWVRQPDQSLVCRVDSEAETRAVGEAIAAKLLAGDVVALIGGLGAGKTHFVKGVAEACGVSQDDVNSPTFTLIQEYAGRMLIRHCDTYRLRNAEEFADLGLDELFASDGIIFPAIAWKFASQSIVRRAGRLKSRRPENVPGRFFPSSFVPRRRLRHCEGPYPRLMALSIRSWGILRF